ncbi:MAG TPA: hypothetical protein VNZ57_12315 [Longimicrobiales bacterium]|nr:hypothetical protein [Longimicrobiales bacterium]
MNPPRPLSDADEARLPHGRLGPAPGTLILVLIFLAAFGIYYFANWKLLSFVWRIG